MIPDLDDISRRRRRNLQDDEDEIECMRNIKSGSFKYKGVLEKTILESKSNRRQNPEAKKKARYIPEADEDEAYLENIKPKESSISMNNNNDIPRRRFPYSSIFKIMEIKILEQTKTKSQQYQFSNRVKFTKRLDNFNSPRRQSNPAKVSFFI